MMNEAQDVCHHWIAHILPLYVLLFSSSPSSLVSTAGQLIVRVRNTMPSLRLAEEKPVNVHLQGSDIRSCGFSNDLGVLYLVTGTCVPYVKSLHGEYMERHGINLTAALQKLQEKKLPEGNRLGPWILHWTRLMAACVQLLCLLKVLADALLAKNLTENFIEK
jgi:hypothetical protein